MANRYDRQSRGYSDQRRRAVRKKSAAAREKKRIRRQIRITSLLMVVPFIMMIFYTVTYSATQEETLFENDYNGREEVLLSKNSRGKIYAADGTVLADTTVDAEGNSTRVYPFGSLFAHVVGYDEEGGSGIELQYNYQLVHSDLTLAEKSSYDNVGEKYPSNEVYTTLNVDLQQAASDALGDYKGAIVVSDVKTGKILAMVSKPDFDPGSIEENWDALLADSTSGTLVNRVSQGLYAPGSTFKIFDAIEYMNENGINPDEHVFDCSGYTTVDGETITCYHWEVHGHLDFEGAFAKSCNSAFATIGTELNRDSFERTLNNMMFGESLPYEMPSETSRYVLDNTTSTKEVMQLAIGQGQTVMTPLHLNLITAAVANGGVVYTPYVVESVRTAQTSANPEGKILSQNNPTEYRTIMTEDEASAMRQMMRAVVEYGTATKILTRSYYAAGKTGSAEFITNQSDSHAWFTGFAPYDDPQVAITVIVEGAGSGGSMAVPVARDVLDAYFGYTGTDAEQAVKYFTTNDITPLESIAADGEDETPETTISLNLDTNGDGILDAIDLNGDGVPEAFDTTGDGRADTQAVNGQLPVAQPVETTETETTEVEQTENTEQTAEEIPGADAASDEQQAQQDETISQLEQSTTEPAQPAAPDSDGDGIPDTEDSDANGNGIDDEEEAAAAEAAAAAAAAGGVVDANGDGIDDNTGLVIQQ